MAPSPLDDLNVLFPEGVYADVRFEHSLETTVRIRQGELHGVSSRVQLGAFLRVFRQGRWLLGSTTRLDQVYERLRALAEGTALPAGPHAGAAALLRPHVADVRRFNDDERVDLIDIDDKIAALLDLQVELEASPPTTASDPPPARVTTWRADYLDNYTEKRFLSSKGADVRHDMQSAGVGLRFTMGRGADSLSEQFTRGGPRFQDVLGGRPALARRLAQCRAWVGSAEAVEPGEYTVILAPIVAGVFAHESFGHKSEADFMLGDETMMQAWSIGTRVGAPGLSIIDDGADLTRGFTPYDDEGQPARRTFLMQDGVLRGRLHSVGTAAALDEAVTGNARAMSFRFEPIVRMTNTWIDRGDLSRDALFAGVEHGYFIETFKHGSGLSTFTIAPGLAWRIEHGEVVAPARIAVITGTVFETLGEIDGLSDEVEIHWGVEGGCGKNDQWPLPVAFGGPHVRIRKMRVA